MYFLRDEVVLQFWLFYLFFWIFMILSLSMSNLESSYLHFSFRLSNMYLQFILNIYNHKVQTFSLTFFNCLIFCISSKIVMYQTAQILLITRNMCFFFLVSKNTLQRLLFGIQKKIELEWGVFFLLGRRALHLYE